MTPARISPKIIIVILALFLAAGGVFLGVFLVKQRQELRKKAAVPEGEATVSISPSAETHQVNESFPASIYFNTANIAVSGIAIRITYPYSGSTPELTASGIQINPSLLSTGEWSCPVKNVTPEAGMIKIDIACFNTNTAGFSTSTDTLLASFTLIANQVPATNPTVLRFEPTQSIITRKSDGQDILLIPTSTGSYTITGTGGATPTPTPIPTATPTQIPGSTPTPTPTSGSGVTPTPTPTRTPTPTATSANGLGGGSLPTSTPVPTQAPIPVSGVSSVTIVGIVVGVFAVIGSLLLVL